MTSFLYLIYLMINYTTIIMLEYKNISHVTYISLNTSVQKEDKKSSIFKTIYSITWLSEHVFTTLGERQAHASKSICSYLYHSFQLFCLTAVAVKKWFLKSENKIIYQKKLSGENTTFSDSRWFCSEKYKYLGVNNFTSVTRLA